MREPTPAALAVSRAEPPPSATSPSQPCSRYAAHARHEREVGVRVHVGEHGGAVPARERAVGDPDGGDARVGDEQRPADAELADELADAPDRPEAVNEPRRHLDAADGIDLNAHDDERIVPVMPYADLSLEAFGDAISSARPPRRAAPRRPSRRLAAALAELTARFSDDEAGAEEAATYAAGCSRLPTRTRPRTRRSCAPGATRRAAAQSTSRSSSPRRPPRSRGSARGSSAGNPRLVGDASAAVELARAAVRVGARLVELNLEGPDPRAAQARALATRA